MAGSALPRQTPKVGAVCGNSARTVLCGGRAVRRVPTAIHSHTLDLAAVYRVRVAAMGAGILTGIGGPEPLFQTAIRQGSMRLATAAGGTLVINIHRQPRARPGKAMSRCQIAHELAPLLASPVRGC